MHESRRTKTFNNMGYMHNFSDPALEAFLDHVDRSKGTFADIGAAFGYATIEALKRGGRVLAIDLDQNHLNVLRDVCPSTFCSQLEIQCGHFPNTIDLAENSFDGILCSRVLIFLKADEIDSALAKIYKALKPSGYVYISSPSPLRKKWASLKPSYKQQKTEESAWPGSIHNFWDLMPAMKEILPQSIQLIDAESLASGLRKAGFTVIDCDYSPKVDTSDEEAFTLCYAIAMK